jgi:hypothetical protein
MRLSRLGQGLAVSAVSALVITGVAVSAPAVAAEGGGVRLLSQQDGIASVRSPIGVPIGGVVTLAAEQLDATATISFEYNADPAADEASEGWLAITPSGTSQAGPYVAVDWAPDPSLVGASISLRAVATSPTGTAYATRNDVALSGDGSEVNSVTLDTVAPFFAQPYADSDRTASLMAVSGGTSAVDGTVELSAWNTSTGQFDGAVQAAVTFLPTKVPGGGLPFLGSRFDGVLDISGYDAGDGDALAVRAERDSDDVAPVLLRAQTITSITATSDAVAGPETTPVTIQVLDQDEWPVIGAEVRRSSDGGLVGYTDRNGRVVADQSSNTAESYYTNTTDVDAFEEGLDVRTVPVQTPDYVPAATATIAELADGTVFDDQEYGAGDIALQVVDGRGEPFAAQEQVTYTLGLTGDESIEPVTATTDGEGRLVVPFDPEWQDGEYTLAFTAPGSTGGADEEPVTFVAGDALLSMSPLAGTAPSGGTITYAGTLTVEGAPLAGRDIDLAFVRGTEQAPGTEADAGLLVDGHRVLAGETTTDRDGTFTVSVADAVEAGGPGETGGVLRVTARGTGDELTATAEFAPAPTTQTPTSTPTPTPTPAPTVTPTPAAGKAVVELALTGADTRDGSDRLRIRGPRAAAGERIRIHVLTPGGFWRVLDGLDLDERGDATVVVPDLNGRKVTRYRVRLVPNPRVKAFTSRVLRLR